MQWTQEDAQALIERGQAPLVFNEVKPTIDWIIGTERRTRVDYKILPREKDDEALAEIKTKLMKCESIWLVCSCPFTSHRLRLRPHRLNQAFHITYGKNLSANHVTGLVVALSLHGRVMVWPQGAVVANVVVSLHGFEHIGLALVMESFFKQRHTAPDVAEMGKETGGVTICAMPVMTMARWFKNPTFLGPKPSVLRV